jgi:hypothetical protein
MNTAHDQRHQGNTETLQFRSRNVVTLSQETTSIYAHDDREYTAVQSLPIN